MQKINGETSTFFAHLPTSERKRLSLKRPRDLFDQVQKIAFRDFTSRLPSQEREEFCCELNAIVYERWIEPTRTWDPGKGAFSLWVHLRARETFTDFTRKLQRQLDRFSSISPIRESDSNNGSCISDDWLYGRKSPVYAMHDPFSTDSIDFDEMVEDASKCIPLSEHERIVLGCRYDGHSVEEIVQLTELPEDDVRLSLVIIRKKLRAIKMIKDVRIRPRDRVDSVVRIHANRRVPFPTTPFSIAIDSFKLRKELIGIVGVKQGIEFSSGAAAVKKDCKIEIDLSLENERNAQVIWTKYSRIVKSCSKLRIDIDGSISIRGVLSDIEPGADIIWAIALAETCRSRKVRTSVPFEPTRRDFSMFVANMKSLKVVSDPAFAAAAESWRSRLYA